MTKQSKLTHPHRIELKSREVSQLFNSMDPSPFNEKDQINAAVVVLWIETVPSHLFGDSFNVV